MIGLIKIDLHDVIKHGLLRKFDSCYQKNYTDSYIPSSP
jgi:hypothetical protein